MIVPGILLTIRYALIDSVVILEGANASESRKRSSEITAVKMWQIFGAYVLFFPVYLILYSMVYIPVDVMIELGFIEQFSSMIICIVIDCTLDVIYAIIIIGLGTKSPYIYQYVNQCDGKCYCDLV